MPPASAGRHVRHWSRPTAAEGVEDAARRGAMGAWWKAKKVFPARKTFGRITVSLGVLPTGIGGGGAWLGDIFGVLLSIVLAW